MPQHSLLVGQQNLSTLLLHSVILLTFEVFMLPLSKVLKLQNPQDPGKKNNKQ